MSVNQDVQHAPTRGVLLVLDKPRRLRFTMSAIKKMREAFGDDALTDGIEVDSISKMVWFGLIHEDPDLTPEAVDDMIDLQNLEEVSAAVSEATGRRARVEVEGKQLGSTDKTVDASPPPLAEEQTETASQAPDKTT